MPVEQGKEIMDLQLVVLAGAKHGTRIPLKKDEFVIGRSRECTLRAGSEAVSRRHCALVRSESGWLVRDLGSRNGTFLNDERIEGESPLQVGDELRVGPLKFRVEQRESHKAAKPKESKQSKQPPVEDVADAVQRTASKGHGSASEEDISRWLLGVTDTETAETMKETRTVSMEETSQLEKAALPQSDTAEEDAADQLHPSQDEPAGNHAADDSADGQSDSDKSGSWSWLKLGKGRRKKKPGKLPQRPVEPDTKDSREAAADILREMTRRH